MITTIHLFAAVNILLALAACATMDEHAVCYVFGWNVTIVCQPDRLQETRQ